MQTYLVLLDPKDETITFKTQKYLNKSMPVVHPVLQQWYEWCSHDISGVAIQGSHGAIYRPNMTCSWNSPSCVCTAYILCHCINKIK